MVFGLSAIIFETKSENNYDKIILIQSPLEIRIERVINRDNISREEVMKRINNQLDENLIIDKCDYVISNENKEDLEDKVLKVTKIFKDTGSDSKTLDLVKEYTAQALKSIDKLIIPDDNKLQLINFSKSLMDRKL